MAQPDGAMSVETCPFVVLFVALLALLVVGKASEMCGPCNVVSFAALSASLPPIAFMFSKRGGSIRSPVFFRPARTAVSKAQAQIWF